MKSPDEYEELAEKALTIYSHALTDIVEAQVYATLAVASALKDILEKMSDP